MITQVFAAPVALIAAALGLFIGWKLGLRNRLMHQEKARNEGRTESSIDLARHQERVTFMETTVQQQRERESVLQGEHQRSEERVLRTETESAQLRGRLASLSELDKARERAVGEATTASTALAAQRELASRLAAQIEGAAAAIQQKDQRVTELGALEQTLRGHLAEREANIQQAREQCGSLRAELEGASTIIRTLQAAQAQSKVESAALQAQLVQLNVQNAELQTSLEAERTHSEEKLNVLLSSRDILVNQFKSLASEILEEKSRRFTEQNAAALGHLLSPVREQLQAFHSKVDEVYRTEGQERAALGEQLKQLLQLNQSLSADAQNLTRALKGDQKTQGTWGEIVLDTVLEQAGLVEGTHYDRQGVYEAEDQKRAIPDVVIRLPGDRQLVVDSKVSLTAYERSATAGTAEERESQIKQHLASLRTHIRSLSDKNYQQLYDLKSLDFVLLFVPLEPAFSTAVSHDNLIFREAWDRNVILVSPSTLLFVVRTVAYLWRQENQARNVVEIAKRGAALYDKLCGFVEDLEDVGKRIQQSVKAYDAAMRKLAVGDGNVIRQAEMLRDLGVKPSKQLPMSLVDRALSKAQESLLIETSTSEGGVLNQPPSGVASDADTAA